MSFGHLVSVIINIIIIITTTQQSHQYASIDEFIGDICSYLLPMISSFEHPSDLVAGIFQFNGSSILDMIRYNEADHSLTHSPKHSPS